MLRQWTDEDTEAENVRNEAPYRLEQYAGLKKQIKELEGQIKALEPYVSEYITTDCNGKYESEIGRFVIQTRRKFKYSDAVTELEADVKKQKKVEEVSGTAEVVEERQSLVFYSK